MQYTHVQQVTPVSDTVQCTHVQQAAGLYKDINGSMVYLSTAHTTVNINPDVKHPASSDLVRSNQSLQECKTCCRRRLGLMKDLHRSTTMINMNDNELRAIYPEDKECV